MSQDKVPVTLVRESDDPIVSEVFERLAKGTVGVVNIHRTLANSPEVFAAFIGLAHALRFKTQVDAAARELAILRVLEKHRGHYEIAHHRKMALAAGATSAQVEGTSDVTITSSLYDAQKLAVLLYADAFASGAGVPKDIANDLAKHFDNRQIIELTLTLSLYLGLSHLTNALDIAVD